MFFDKLPMYHNGNALKFFAHLAYAIRKNLRQERLDRECNKVLRTWSQLSPSWFWTNHLRDRVKMLNNSMEKLHIEMTFVANMNGSGWHKGISHFKASDELRTRPLSYLWYTITFWNEHMSFDQRTVEMHDLWELRLDAWQWEINSIIEDTSESYSRSYEHVHQGESSNSLLSVSVYTYYLM